MSLLQLEWIDFRDERDACQQTAVDNTIIGRPRKVYSVLFYCLYLSLIFNKLYVLGMTSLSLLHCVITVIVVLFVAENFLSRPNTQIYDYS